MSEVLVDRQGRVSVITINRPERHNALNAAAVAGLRAAVDEFERDPQRRVAVLTGAGERAFCAGADLTELADRLDAEGRPPVAAVPDIAGVAAAGKPVIAAVNGLAVAGGLELALCCDIRIAAESAWFAAFEVEHGLVAGVAVSRLPGLVPFGHAMDLLLSADRWSAEEAHRIGLVQRVVPGSRLLEVAVARAETIAGHSPAAVLATKASLRSWLDGGLADRHRYYRAVAARAIDPAEVAERVTRFRRPAGAEAHPRRSTTSKDKC